MKTREQYAAMAERHAVQSHHFTYGDGADPVAGAALAAEAQVYATLATVAPADTAPLDELSALRSAVAAMLHDADTSADHQLRAAIDQFRSTLAGTPHGGPVLALVEDLVDEMARDAADGAASHRPVRTGGESR